MTKTTFALAAALLAGAALTSAAHAGGIRVGFGFPLGSFVAHSNQSYAGEGYGRGRHCDKPRHATRRKHLAASTPARKIKRAQKSQVASSSSKSIAKTAKLEGRLASNESTTTEIAKTSAADTTTTQSTASTSTTTTAVLDKESSSSGTTTTFTPAKTEVAKDEKVATSKVATSSAAPDVKKTSIVTEAKRVCRRFSAAIAGLVDVPCQ